MGVAEYQRRFADPEYPSQVARVLSLEFQRESAARLFELECEEQRLLMKVDIYEHRRKFIDFLLTLPKTQIDKYIQEYEQDGSELAVLDDLLDRRLKDYLAAFKARSGIMLRNGFALLSPEKVSPAQMSLLEANNILLSKEEADKDIAQNKKYVEKIIIEAKKEEGLLNLKSDQKLTDVFAIVNQALGKLEQQLEQVQNEKITLSDPIVTYESEQLEAQQQLRDKVFERIESSLYRACEKSDLARVREMLSGYPSNKRKRMVNQTLAGYYPLHIAVANKHRAIVQFLLKQGADPKLKDLEEHDAHYYARGDDEILRLERGCLSSFCELFSARQAREEAASSKAQAAAGQAGGSEEPVKSSEFTAS